VLGYYYLKYANSPVDSERAYAAAASLSSSITDDANRAKHYTLLAYDALYRDLPNRKNVVRNYLQSAAQAANNIYTGGSDDTAMTAAGNEIDAFLSIADRYAAINDTDNAKTTLERAESTAGYIVDASTKLYNLRKIFNSYAVNVSPDIAVNKANIISFLTDLYGTLNAIADTILGKSYFSEDIAFADTDRDGKPDFFVPWTTLEQIAESGLVLDDDIDGDGVLDTVDLTPFYAD
jgi:hypothetical protein